MRELEVGDDVTDDTIEAYNTLIHGPRHVKHQGRPRDGDKVGSILGRGHSFGHCHVGPNSQLLPICFKAHVIQGALHKAHRLDFCWTMV